MLFHVLHEGICAAVVQAEDVGLADAQWLLSAGLSVARSGHTRAQDLRDEAMLSPWPRSAAASLRGSLGRRHGQVILAIILLELQNHYENKNNNNNNRRRPSMSEAGRKTLRKLRPERNELPKPAVRPRIPKVA